MPNTPARWWSAKGIKPMIKPELAVEIPVTLPASVTYYKGTILGEKYGTDEVQSLSLGANTNAGTFTITFGGQTTSNIAYNATAATVQTALLALSTIANNAVQTITLNSPTGGTWQIGFQGQRTVQMPYNETSANVQTALRNLVNIGTTGVTVTGSNGGPYTLTFAGPLANTPLQAVEASNMFLLPPNTTITVAVVSPGGGAQNILAAGGPLPGTAVTLTFQNRLGKTNVSTLTTTDSLTGGTSAISVTTQGLAGTPNLFSALNTSATDGTQKARAILQFDCATDSAGNITIGWSSTGEPVSGATFLTVPAFVGGYFDANDILNLSDSALSDMGGRFIQGSIAAGGIIRIP